MKEIETLNTILIISFITGYLILIYKLKVWHEKSVLRKEMIEYYKNKNNKEKEQKRIAQN
ncbi:MAG: hypothetical protein ACOX0Z_02595 [Candidatus Nanosyncoccaceae bacterium]|jgi:DNA polymerase III delta subunit